MSEAAATSAAARIEQDLARSQVYGCLAALLADPAGVLDEVRIPDLRRIAAAADPDIRPELDRLGEALEGLRDGPREVDREYTSLFLKAEAPPYEGSYVPAVRLTQELADIAGFLRAFGLRPARDRPDHLVTELDFVAFLCLKAAIAEAQGRAEEADLCRDARAKFLRDHLGRWVEAHARTVRETARLRVYPAILEAVGKIVREDAASLRVSLEPLTEARKDGEELLPVCGLAH